MTKMNTMANIRQILHGPAPASAFQLRITIASNPERRAMIDEKAPHERSLDTSALKIEAIPPQMK